MRQFRINERIVAQQVMLILSDGKAFGKTSKAIALNMARQEGLDLVEVSNGNPPTCKIADFGKMQYDLRKSEKHKNHAPATKEIRIKYKTEAHDLEIKKKKIEEFLSKGHRVIFSMEVIGRERYVAGHAAKEKFEQMVREYFPNTKRNDIQENGKGYTVTLSPS